MSKIEDVAELQERQPMHIYHVYESRKVCFRLINISMPDELHDRRQKEVDLTTGISLLAQGDKEFSVVWDICFHIGILGLNCNDRTDNHFQGVVC